MRTGRVCVGGGSGCSAIPARRVPRGRVFVGGGSGGLASDDTSVLAEESAQDLAKAVVLSQVGSHAVLQQLLQADWVESWEGWEELRSGGTEGKCVEVAERFLKISGQDVGGTIWTDDEKLHELEREGLAQRIASPHGRNNCLIDALILCLCNEGQIPSDLARSPANRKHLVDACREKVIEEIGPAAGDIEDDIFPYLDAERDAALIVRFLLQRFGASERNYMLVVHDRFGGGEADPNRGRIGIRLAEGWDGSDVEIHVYNHTDGRARGYHFDALIPRTNARVVAGSSKDRESRALSGEHGQARRQTSPAEVSFDRDKAKRVLQAFMAKRCEGITINAKDIEQLEQNWGRAEELGMQIQTLMCAGNVYMERGRHNARYLAQVFRGYYTVMTQELGQKLGRRVDREEASTGREEEKTTRKRAKNSTGPKRETVSGARVDGSNEEANMPPLKRMRRKGPDPRKTMETTTLPPDMFHLQVQAPGAEWQDPRAMREAAIRRIARELNGKPTLPNRFQTLRGNEEGYDLPEVHCAFRGCAWEGGDEAELTEHLVAAHRHLLLDENQKEWAPEKVAEQVLSKYEAAVSCVCRAGAPVANPSIDRRCLRAYRREFEGESLTALICFICARRFPHRDDGKNMSIAYKRAMNKDCTRILGRTPDELELLLGLKTYRDLYGGIAAEAGESYDVWSCNVECKDGKSLSLLCCPEDKRCRKGCKPDRLCSACEIPVCASCWCAVAHEGAVPPEALSNDMMLFYGPEEIYDQQVTFMEMVCASPCVTTLMCFSLEKKYRSDRAWDEKAWMNRHRLAARGNATSFPLAWEDLVEQLQGLETRLQVSGLPRSGQELAEVVNVMIKSNDGSREEKGEGLRDILHQASVRRHVVVGLIQEAVRRQHPAYKSVEMERVLEKAQSLPEHGVPAEVIAVLPHDDDIDHLQPQKAATPVPEAVLPERVAIEMGDWLKPNAVVSERSGVGLGDANTRQVAALEATAAHVHGGALPDSMHATLVTGNRLLNQFQPEYFAMAFPFLFKYGMAMPDPPRWCGKPRHRRTETAPRIELSTWVRAMARRCESQVQRDWVFGFASWNLLFRSALNLSRIPVRYTDPVYDEAAKKWRSLTGKDIERGAMQLMVALGGTYVDMRGKPRPVKGDMSKLKYVRNLQPAARKLVQHMRSTGATLPGTQESRRRMRFEIEALRIKFGVPLFVTFSPDEAHQLLYIRMSRTRATDPVRRTPVWDEWIAGDKEYPELAQAQTMAIHIESMRRMLPTWEQRRATLARDPLASVDGFQLLVQLVLKHLFGLRVCEACPSCNVKQWRTQPCTRPATGSNATLVGGIFGRMDAAYITIEAQKSTGSLHAHGQCFVQCLHQHTPVAEIFSLAESRLATLRADYLEYVSHVSHSIYKEQARSEVTAGISAAEGAWPEYEEDTVMTSFPKYQSARCTDSAGTRMEDMEAREWAREYLCKDVVQLQYMKQHHYHKYNVETGERIPLRGCQRADKPGECKNDYPRTGWVNDAARVLCPCALADMGLPQHGRKNRLCSLQAPYGHEYLNPCHPAMLAGIRGGNVDVQVPYRLPFACATCGTELSDGQRAGVVAAVQRAQDAQTGYCSDYCAKNQPMAFHEIREFLKGHSRLQAEAVARGDPLEKVGKKHAMRIMSDAYQKGIVRGQVEGCNLRANHREDTVVAAERVSTAEFTSFPGHAFLNTVRRLADHDDAVPQRTAWRQRQQRLQRFDWARAYGHRPGQNGLWELSPYEFFMYWDVVPAKIPTTKKEWEESQSSKWDVAMTPGGASKVSKAKAGTSILKLRPGQDYKLKARQHNGCAQYSATSGAGLAHSWFLQRRPAPRVPCFSHCPVPRRLDEDLEENARLTLAYFRSWTLDTRRSTANVVHVGSLRQRYETWESALRGWLGRLPCQETKEYVGNFLSVYRVRPATDGQDNSDDDAADAALEVKEQDLPAALGTKCPQVGRRQAQDGEDRDDARVVDALRRVEAMWATGAIEAETERSRNSWADVSAEEAVKAARQRASRSTKAGKCRPADPTALVSCHGDVEAEIDAWLLTLVPPKCNAEQRDFCTKVAMRVKDELGQVSGVRNEEPLRWALHGGPGTGKSYALDLVRRELFEGVLGWKQGAEFQVVTLQAVMAESLEGDTIHHALGLNWKGEGGDGISDARMLDLCAAALQWRWLFIDEISMVGAELVARVELRCREMVRDLSKYKYGTSNTPKPFGGLNVVLSGDLWQLPPPRGTFLGEVPWEMITKAGNKKLALTVRGQELIWGGRQHGIQGVTELTKCERTQDEWLQEVQAQLRNGALSDDNHAFLHGRRTKMPGSMCKGALQCKQAACQQLLQEQASEEKVWQKECQVCKAERRSKARVVGSLEPEARCTEAVAILPTNAVKYHVNKVRALEWAKQRGERLRYSIGQDRISATALREKPDLREEKLGWLQRHDQECGGLYGVLPLCIGMPVRATDHLDRGRGILRGCRGVVVGWAKETDSAVDPMGKNVIWNDLPAAIYVRFETASSWTIGNLQEANVYPVTPQRKRWHLDKHRKRPILSIVRKQYPLAPAFATTAHAAQGQTAKHSVVADLDIGPNGDPLTAYVAVTRVTGRETLAILRPFDARSYQRGTRIGRELLLEVWRGEEVDWDALRRKYFEEKPCAECHVQKRKTEFTAGQWKRVDDKRICKECVQRHADDGEPWQCSACSLWQQPAQFQAKHQRPQCTFYRVCLACENHKVCNRCSCLLPRTDFSAAAWRSKKEDRICTKCCKKEKGMWTCSSCKTRECHDAFSRWSMGRAGKQNGRQRCNRCIEKKRTAKRVRTRIARTRGKIVKQERQRTIEQVRKEIAARVASRKSAERSPCDRSPRENLPAGRTPPKRCRSDDGAHEKRVRPYRSPNANLDNNFVAHEQEQEQCIPQGDRRRGHERAWATERKEYECPYCQETTYSSVRTGNVQVAGHCGKQFRVRNGVVVRSFTHACPRCGTEVQSTKATGRIQSQHQKPNGKACPTTAWEGK